MRKLIVSALMASTFAIAAPASAQYQQPYGDNGNYRSQNYGNYPSQNYGYQQQGRQLQQQIYQLRERIQRVSQRGAVSRNEAIRLQRELYQIERRYNQFARNGISRKEEYDLRSRIQNLRQQIREDRRDGRGYNDGHGNDGRYHDDRNDNRRYDDDRRYERRDRNEDHGDD